MNLVIITRKITRNLNMWFMDFLYWLVAEVRQFSSLGEPGGGGGVGVGGDGGVGSGQSVENWPSNSKIMNYNSFIQFRQFKWGND